MNRREFQALGTAASVLGVVVAFAVNNRNKLRDVPAEKLDIVEANP